MLEEVLGRGDTAVAVADLEALTRLMLVAIVSPGDSCRPAGSPKASSPAAVCWSPASASVCLPACPPVRLPAFRCRLPYTSEPPCPPAQALRQSAQLLIGGLDILHAIRCPLFERAAPLDLQLAALRQRCGGGSNGNIGSNLPTVAQLQAGWAALYFELVHSGMRQGLPKAELAACGEQAARKLPALQPNRPCSSYVLGSAAFFNNRTGSASRLRDALPHFRRGAELARAQGSDFWLARWAGGWGLGRLV